jgi:hemerythrin
MAFFDWKDEYSVGIEEIDEQHKKIILLMNELIENIRDAREDCIIMEVLNDLQDYAKYHFRLEAEIFYRFDYFNVREHLVQHEYFVQKLQVLIKEELEKNNHVPQKTFDYLVDWFRGHMMKTDIEYSKYFMTKGVIEDIRSFIRHASERK